jgi:hypothetical protein
VSINGLFLLGDAEVLEPVLVLFNRIEIVEGVVPVNVASVPRSVERVLLLPKDVEAGTFCTQCGWISSYMFEQLTWMHYPVLFNGRDDGQDVKPGNVVSVPDHADRVLPQPEGVESNETVWFNSCYFRCFRIDVTL